jgi:hypothetical protein
MEQAIMRIEFPVVESQKAQVIIGLQAILDAFPGCDRITAVRALAELEQATRFAS